jgi:hypothetical protein
MRLHNWLPTKQKKPEPPGTSSEVRQDQAWQKMKELLDMRYMIAIIVTFAFCLPARAEILIFQTSTSGQQFLVADKIIEKKSERGYLVIDADLANPDSVVVNTVYHLHYETKAGKKVQYTTIPGDVELIMITYNKGKKIILRYFDETTGTYMVVYGNASLKDIGGIQRYVGNMSGNSVWREQDYRTGSGGIKLNLDIKATKLANTTPGKTITQIIEGYSQTLITKGYSAE